MADQLDQLFDDVLNSGRFRDWTDEEMSEDYWGRFLPLRPFCFPHWTFDVLDGATWYRIDAHLPESEFYEGVPDAVQKRARAAIRERLDEAIDELNRVGRSPSILCDVDHTEEYESIFRTVFEDVRFVETDFEPGVRW